MNHSGAFSYIGPFQEEAKRFQELCASRQELKEQLFLWQLFHMGEDLKAQAERLKEARADEEEVFGNIFNSLSGSLTTLACSLAKSDLTLSGKLTCLTKLSVLHVGNAPPLSSPSLTARSLLMTWFACRSEQSHDFSECFQTTKRIKLKEEEEFMEETLKSEEAELSKVTGVSSVFRLSAMLMLQL